MNDDTMDDLNLNLHLNDQPFTPSPSDGLPQHDANSVVSVTLGMWNHLLNRLSSLEALLETQLNNQEQALETLDINLIISSCPETLWGLTKWLTHVDANRVA